jgi:hypothetical protein
MTRQQHQLALRRQRLRVRIASQRLEIASLTDHFHTPLHLGDKLIAAVRFLRAHPTLLASATGLLAWRRNTPSNLARMGWRLWQLYCLARGQGQR